MVLGENRSGWLVFVSTSQHGSGLLPVNKDLLANNCL